MRVSILIHTAKYILIHFLRLIRYFHAKRLSGKFCKIDHTGGYEYIYRIDEKIIASTVVNKNLVFLFPMIYEIRTE